MFGARMIRLSLDRSALVALALISTGCDAVVDAWNELTAPPHFVDAPPEVSLIPAGSGWQCAHASSEAGCQRDCVPPSPVGGVDPPGPQCSTVAEAYCLTLRYSDGTPGIECSPDLPSCERNRANSAGASRVTQCRAVR